MLRAPAAQAVTASRAACLARLLKALADPTRLRLVSMVAARESGEAHVCDVTEPLGLTQAAAAHAYIESRRAFGRVLLKP